MINNLHRRNNAMARICLLSILLAVTLAAIWLTGCSRKQGAESPGQGDRAVVRLDDCRVTIDASGWLRFKGLAQQLGTAEKPSREDLIAFAETPALTIWRQSLRPNEPLPQRIADWMAYAFDPQERERPKRKPVFEQRSFDRLYNYCFAQREAISDYIARYMSDGGPCRALEIAREWIDPEHLAADLTLVFLPAKPEIRLLDDHLIVDVGVAYAGGADQLNRQIASLLYRDRQGIKGDNPLRCRGAAAIAQSLRVLVNEGTAAWISRVGDTYFGHDHPSLFGNLVPPEEYYEDALETVATWNRLLAVLLGDPEQLQSHGHDFSRYMGGSGAFLGMGYCMANAIVGRLGEERLRQVSRSVPDFIAAYQEAASANPQPYPVPGAAGHELYESLPPLAPEVFEKLHALLLQEFAEAE